MRRLDVITSASRSILRDPGCPSMHILNQFNYAAIGLGCSGTSHDALRVSSSLNSFHSPHVYTPLLYRAIINV